MFDGHGGFRKELWLTHWVAAAHRDFGTFRLFVEGYLRNVHGFLRCPLCLPTYSNDNDKSMVCLPFLNLILNYFDTLRNLGAHSILVIMCRLKLSTIKVL